jgi:hypothetical protein
LIDKRDLLRFLERFEEFADDATLSGDSGGGAALGVPQEFAEQVVIGAEIIDS